MNISLKLNLPTKNLYGILTSSFEDAETEVINYVTEGIDIEDIRAALSESILSYYDKKKTNYKAVVRLNPKFSALDSTCEFTLRILKNK